MVVVALLEKDNMAITLHTSLWVVCLVACCLAATDDFNDKLIAQKMEVDAKWVDSEAHHQLDIVIVLDQSGSVGVDNYARSKQWIRSFLDFFSVSKQFTQVGLVTFSSAAKVEIPLYRGITKCEFLTLLDKVPYEGGATNIGAGLDMTYQLLSQGSRPNVPRKLIVMISDGWYTQGPDPFSQQQKIMKRYPKSYFMVVAIGAANDFITQLSNLATADRYGKKMLFGLKDFKNFAHVAYYFHKGEQGSQLFQVPESNCTSPRCDTKSKSFCACDSLGRGEYQCGCNAGYYAISDTKHKVDKCQACTNGEYTEKKTARRTCRKCSGGARETTLQKGSSSRGDCICGSGFVNQVNQRSKVPPCTLIKCPGPEPQQLDRSRVALSGSCKITSGSKCNFKCKYGHQPAVKENLNLQCMPDGQWSHAFPQCTAIFCPVLTDVGNSKGWKCAASPGLSMFQHGTQCQSSCKSGFKPKSGTSAFRMCGGDGQWSGTPLQCEPKTCSVLPDIPNGGYLIPQCNRGSADRPFGMICAVQCNSGFKLRSTGTPKYRCTEQGNWDSTATQPECVDIQPPQIPGCASVKHQYLDNEEGLSFARFKIVAPKATDNSNIKPTLQISIKTPIDTLEDVETTSDYPFPIGTSIVTYKYSDSAGNKGFCSFEVTVKDIEPPRVVSCDGPVTKDSYIFTKDKMAYVTWDIPKFSDNSGQKVNVYSTSTPGEFGLATYTIKYTATDGASNSAVCTFKFTVTGTPCPPLHVPINGALACDDMSFGTVCAPQCQRGLAPFYPLDIRPVREYFCTLKGEWRPSHAYVPDCSIRSPWEDDILLTFEGDCADEETKRQIQKTTFESLQDSFVGSNFIASTGLTYENIHVQCGAKNETIISNGGFNRRRRSTDHEVSDMEEELHLSDLALNRNKRALTDAQLKQLQDLLKGKLNGKFNVVKAPCPVGSELRKRTCFKCPPGYYWYGSTRKCVKCPVGTYSLKDGTISRCTSCPQGTTTASEGSSNTTQCVEQCPLGHYSSNGLMYPINCKACPAGKYSAGVGMKACTTCPASTTTSDTGAKDVTYCQPQCLAGFYSHNGLSPCQKCPLNTYQTKIGQRSCVNCPTGKTTLSTGARSSNQCIVINECDSNPCRNGGGCIDGTNKFICTCKPGWSGKMCEQNIDECASKPCWSGATCVDKVNGFQCVCPRGFEGSLCNLNINECKTNPCANKGVCIDLNGDFECSCQAGYGGKTCTINQPDCSPGICENGGRCEDRLNGFVCKCASGFRGESCTENIDDCQRNTCQNGATCVDLINQYSCKCAPGFTGSKCEVNINECAGNPCKNGGRCTDKVNDYNCTCVNNWGDKQCTRGLSDCFNLNMNGNTIEDYVVYDPAYPVPAMGAITVRFSMRSNDKGLQAHYGTILSYAKEGQEGLFNIRAFPEQMIQVNKEDWLTGVDATDNTWQNICMTWQASNGAWKAYRSRGRGVGLRLEKTGTSQQLLSKGKNIPGGGRFVIGQLYQGKEDEFNEGNIYQGELSQLNIWYKYDQCLFSNSSPDLTWANLVNNGKIVAQTNRNMKRNGSKLDSRC